MDEHLLGCSFCRRSKDVAAVLMPGVDGCRICERCLEESSHVLLNPSSSESSDFRISVHDIASCSFCGRKGKQVSKILEREGCKICSACIESWVYPWVVIRGGWVVNPRGRLGGWLINSKNRLLRRLLDERAP